MRKLYGAIAVMLCVVTVTWSGTTKGYTTTATVSVEKLEEQATAGASTHHVKSAFALSLPSPNLSTTTTGGSGHNFVPFDVWYFGVEDNSSWSFGGVLNHTNRASATMSFKLSQNGSTVTGTGYQVSNGDRVGFARLLNVTPGTALKTFLIHHYGAQCDVAGHNEVNGTYDTIRKDYEMGRYDCEAVSIDSRKAFGQPNFEGELVDDPNAGERHVSFVDWIFKGGLFVGNAPANSKDQSGTARIQIYAPTLPTSVASSLSLLYLKRPAKFPDDVVITCYAPSGSDPNLSVTRALANWGNAWDLAGATGVGTITFTSTTPQMDFANFSVSTGSKYILAVDDEASHLSEGSWRYFASVPYKNSITSPTYPLTDPQPRIWALTLPFSDSWTETYHVP